MNKIENAEIKSSVAGGLRHGLPYFFLGGAIGTTLALLFAPKAGNELRGEIADLTRKGYDTTLEKAKELKEHSADAIHTVKEKVESVYDFASAKLAFVNKPVTGDVSAADTPPSLLEDSSAKQARTGRKSSNIL